MKDLKILKSFIFNIKLFPSRLSLPLTETIPYLSPHQSLPLCQEVYTTQKDNEFDLPPSTSEVIYNLTWYTIYMKNINI